MALEDDRVVTLAPAGPAGQTLKRLKETTFVFQPVDGNMAHHSLLGEQPILFDFMAQHVVVDEAEYDEDGRLSSITTILSRSKTSSCRLSNIPFRELSESLYVWYDAESGYKVDTSL